jgi:hypothetical protein
VFGSGGEQTGDSVYPGNFMQQFNVPASIPAGGTFKVMVNNGGPVYTYTSTATTQTGVVADLVAAINAGGYVLAVSSGADAGALIIYYNLTGMVTVDWTNGSGNSQGSTISGTFITGVQFSNMSGLSCSANVTVLNSGNIPIDGYTFDVPANTYQYLFSSLSLPSLPNGIYSVRINSYGSNANSKPFQFWQTIEMAWMTDAVRTKVDCDLKGSGFGISNVFKINELDGKNFILGQCEFDIQNEEANVTLEEIYDDADVFLITAFTNTFNYLYK